MSCIITHGCNDEVRRGESLDRFVEVAGVSCDLCAWASQADRLVRRSRPTDCKVLEPDLPFVEPLGAQRLVWHQ